MSDAGYSGTPLGPKLGLKDGQRALLLRVPAGLDAISGFSGFRASETEIGTVAARDIDYAHVFETERSALEEPRAEAGCEIEAGRHAVGLLAKEGVEAADDTDRGRFA